VSGATLERVSGNRMVAMGALDAGCRFFAGYPITPSSEIYRTMIEEMPARGGIALAAPDEITAAAACVGASLAGHRAMTATSGPGWCLMVETVQYAVMTETPVVFAVVQRLGPSTGAATQGAQGDVLAVQSCVSGGYPIPVFAPADAYECHELTGRAFDWSERLRTPAVVLSDKDVGMTLEGIDLDARVRVPVGSRPAYAGPPDAYRPYARPTPDAAPPFAPVGGRARVVATGSTHDGAGRLRKYDPEVRENLRALRRKVASAADAMADVRVDLDAGADTLVLSWGISARASWEAVERLRAGGRRVSYARVRTLFPLPLAALRPALAGVRRVITVEQNAGLYGSALAAHLADRRHVRVGAVGRAIRPGEIVRAVEERP